MNYYLNKIELQGVVGFVKVQTYSNRKVARINLATKAAYKDKSGDPVIDVQWHSISAWEGKNIENLDSIQKGDNLHIIGRIKYNKFTGADGQDHYTTEIQTDKLAHIKEDSELEVPCS